jgi:hypothetical protein
MLEDIDAWLAIELEKTVQVEAEAWAAWERSKLDSETLTTTRAQVSETGVVEPVEEKLIVKGQSGDPRYLAMIDKCIDRRCKLLGLYAPERVALTDPTGMKEFVADDAKTNVLSRLLREATVVRTQEEISGAE